MFFPHKNITGIIICLIILKMLENIKLEQEKKCIQKTSNTLIISFLFTNYALPQKYGEMKPTVPLYSPPLNSFGNNYYISLWGLTSYNYVPNFILIAFIVSKIFKNILYFFQTSTPGISVRKHLRTYIHRNFFS